MTSVVTIGNATLHHGDCLEIMAGLEPVDHVIGDPPYEDELHAAMGRIQRTDGREMVGDLGFGGVNGMRADVARAVAGISRGWVVLFSLAEGVRAWRDDLQAAGAKWDTTWAWVKPDAAPRFNGQGAARGFECFVTCWCGRGHRSWNGGGRRGVCIHPVNAGRYGGPGGTGRKEGSHPTEKPLALMAEIVALYTNAQDLVLDPFAGSGTTGVACLRAGRRFIGIEKEARFFDLACERLEKAARQPDLFQPVAKPVPARWVVGGRLTGSVRTLVTTDCQ